MLAAGWSVLGFDCTPEYQVPLGGGWNIEPYFGNLPDEFMLTSEHFGLPISRSEVLTGIREACWLDDSVDLITAGRTDDGYFVLSTDRGLLFDENGRLKKPLPVLAKLETFADREAWKQRLAELGCHDVVLRAPTPWDSPGVRNAVYAAIGGACAAAPVAALLGAAFVSIWWRWKTRRRARNVSPN